MYLNSEANISILRTVKIKYVFLFLKSEQTKDFFFSRFCCCLWTLLIVEEQNCLAERQLSLVLCWYFLLKWCFKSCLTVWLHHLMSCITCSLSGLPLPLFMFSDCSGCNDFSGEDSSVFNSCWCRKDLSPRIRMRYYFYDLLGASQLLWATDFLVDFKLPKHTAFS